MKQFLFLFIACLTSTFTYSQTVKEWYFPKTTYNKVTFYMPDVITGNPTEATRTIYYVDKGKSYEITDASIFQGQPVSIETITITFVGNEVKLLSRTVTNSLGVTNKKTKYSPPQTIFKIPIKANITYWTFSGQRYSSTYSTLIFNGVGYNAIKVTQYQPRWNGQTVRYYVMGYGLVETDIVSDNGRVIISDKFNGRAYEDGITSSSNNNSLKSTNLTSVNKPTVTLTVAEQEKINNEINSHDASVRKLDGTKQDLNLADMIDIVKQKQLSLSEIKSFLQGVSSRIWNISSNDTTISFTWNLDDSEYMEYNPQKHTFLIESNYYGIYNSIIKELELNNYKKTVCKPEKGQISKVRYYNARYCILCSRDQGGSMGNSPCAITICRSPTFNISGN